jgi:hypothetical protein
MEKIREIIRLKEQCFLSERKIARALNVSRPVVKQYVRDLKFLGLDYAALKAMDDETLLEIIHTKSQATVDVRAKNSSALELLCSVYGGNTVPSTLRAIATRNSASIFRSGAARLSSPCT